MPLVAGGVVTFFLICVLPRGKRGRDKHGSEVLSRAWRDVGELDVRKI